MTNHDQLLGRITTDPSRSPLMGVVRPSPMADLAGFHPVSSLPTDAMHDFIEGVCPLVIMGLLKKASTSRLLTYGEKIRDLSIDCQCEFRIESIIGHEDDNRK